MIIKNETELRTLIPNVVVAVSGETSLYNKLTPFLENVESWLEVMFLGQSLMTSISAATTLSNPYLNLRTICAKITADMAMAAAIPSLDLVLTPNGFGVVSNNNVAPASKERVERLINSLRNNADNLIEELITALFSITEWKTTQQFQFFSATIFPNIDVSLHLKNLPKYKELTRWETFLDIHPMLINIEGKIGAEWLSPELLDALHKEVLPMTNITLRRNVILQLRAFIIGVLKELPYDGNILAGITDIVRNNKTIFPEWHASNTAKLFELGRFENKKNAGGYWF